MNIPPYSLSLKIFFGLLLFLCVRDVLRAEEAVLLFKLCILIVLNALISLSVAKCKQRPLCAPRHDLVLRLRFHDTILPTPRLKEGIYIFIQGSVEKGKCIRHIVLK